MSFHSIASSKPDAAQGSEVQTSGDHIPSAEVPQWLPNKHDYLWWARRIFIF